MYQISGSEINAKKATDFETKSLLFLYGRHRNKNFFNYYFVDVFNDVTATNEDFTIMVDIQSKGNKSITPKELGKRAVTLFKNYISTFVFEEYLLVISGHLNEKNIKEGILLNEVILLNEYVNDKCISKIKVGLYDKVMDYDGLKSYRSKKSNREIINDIDEFVLNLHLVFATDANYKYIESILGKEYYDEPFLNSIFKEISLKQTAKKISSKIEGEELIKPSDALMFKRHFEFKDFQLLIINRIIMNDYLTNNSANPSSFIFNLAKEKNEYEIQEISSICKDNIRIAICNKNNRDLFWEAFRILFNFVLLRRKIDDLLTMYENVDAVALYNILLVKDKYTELYLISMIKEGVENYDLC